MDAPPRRLVDLDPSWSRASTPAHPYPAEGRRGMGLTFLCPLHGDHYLGVWFQNPIDGLEPHAGGTLWQRTGETFETLRLAPSIRVLGTGGSDSCAWHGYVGAESPGIVTTLSDSM